MINVHVQSISARQVPVLVLLLVLAAGCGPKAKPQTPANPTAVVEAPLFDAPEKPAPRSQAFVGSQACQVCHAEVCHDYQMHPMGRSMAKTTDPPIEDYTDKIRFQLPPAPKSKGHTSYYVEKTADGVFHHEVKTAGDGEQIYDKSVPVHYAVGSGQRGRSYLTAHDGIMLMSPVTWYSEGGRWDLSPGYENNNLHFGRRIVDGCLSCHVGRVATNPEAPDRYQSTAFLEESIGCERCHGPGADHVAFREQGTGVDQIVNPAKLAPRQRDHVCFQCHLIGEHRMLRYGRSEFDFRPGDLLDDIWTILVKGNGVEEEGTTAAVSQVEQMLSSTCYRASEQALGCISCHDPHQVPTDAGRTAYFRDSCLKCHGPEQTECALPADVRLQKSAEDSCIECHMPSVGANDVPHTSQTDHRILRTPEVSHRPPTRRPELKIFELELSQQSAPELDRAMAISLVRTAEHTGNAVLAVDAIRPLEEWVKVVPEDLDAEVALGTAYWLLEDNRLAAKTWEAALQRSPNNEYILRRLFVMCHESEQFEQAAEYGQRLVKSNPWDFEYAGRLAHVLGRLNRFEEATQIAEHALELNPAETRIHNWLIEVYGQLNQPEKSAAHKRIYELLSE